MEGGASRLSMASAIDIEAFDTLKSGAGKSAKGAVYGFVPSIGASGLSRLGVTDAMGSTDPGS